MVDNGYLDFVESHDPGRKTRIWSVVNREGQVPLGEVRFWPKWRKYVFFPVQETLFDSYCLTVIANFLREQTDLWRKKK